jgi:endonuclease III
MSPRPPRAAWRPPSPARVAGLRARLRSVYGVPVVAPHGDALAELVLTVLSQSTNDRNRDVAYLRLRETLPSWEAARDAPVEEVEAAIQPGGLPVQKSRKTAACVLLFAFGARDVPVDTHVGRVATRLGLLRPGAPSAEQHDAMLALTPPGAELELHVNLLRHGRRTCHARMPACAACVLRRSCPSRRS